VGRYFGGVALLRGVISGTVVGSGTPAAPRLFGGISISLGELRVVGLQEAFNDLAVRIDFIDDVVRVTSLSARSSDEGSLVASGWARISNYRPVDYKADVTFRDFWLRSIPDVETRHDGTVSVVLSPWRDGRRIPQITGDLYIREAVIRKDLASGDGGTASEFTLPTDRPDWVCRVDLNAAKNVWIRTPDLTVEMEGDVILNRDERGLYFRGDMSVLRGSYTLIGNKFTITEGTLDFSASETLRPSIEIDAYTPYYGDEETTRSNIYLSLSWPYDQKEPRVRLSFEGGPGYSESDIWRMLGRNKVGAGIATSALERAINEQVTGGFTVNVDQRAVEDSKTPGETETRIGVGKYLWEDVYLQYRRGLSVESEQEVNVEYRLRNRLLLRSQVIYNSRRSTLTGKNTDEYNLDLKYRFEF
jgi:translocation and assembly module TamB